MSIRDRWRRSTIGRSARVLPQSDQRKIFAVAVIQVCLGVLDLLGVLTIGLLGALSVTGLQSQQPGDRVNSVLNFLHLAGASFQVQAAVLGAIAAIFLVGRTILSIFFTRRILFFLSRRGALISANLVSRLLTQPLTKIQDRTTQETLFCVTRGVEFITLQVLGIAVIIVSDVSLLLIMGTGLLIVDSTTAAGTFLIFSAIGYSLYRLMHVRAVNLGVASSQLNIKSNEKIVEVFSSYRESVVSNRRNFYAREIGKLRFELADTMAEINFMPYVSKYVIETTVVLGALLIGVVQFVLQDATQAVATLAIFLAAGTRIAPAVLRIQQSSVQIRGALGMASPTLDLIDSLGNTPLVENVDDTLDLTHKGFDATIRVEQVSFTYPGKNAPAIYDVSVMIPKGSSVAFVGPSGAGKTTIVDVFLGVLSPDFGQVTISGLSPLFAVNKWPGAVSYVPQDVIISNGSIRENVALGYPIDLATDELIMEALTVAKLNQFVQGLPNGIERGAKISGGERQRLGIARAMFTKPHLLILDEATSSLDGETEAAIAASIHALRGTTTVVMIAHRLSTVRNVDIVVYMAEGKVVAKGTFSEVRNFLPDFDRQAKLMGL